MSADSISAAINAPPFGLLDLLQTKALGQNPNELLQAVRATVDVQWMWAQGSPVQYAVVSGAVITLGIPAAAQTLRFIVPASKIWVPISMVTVAVPQGGGESGRVRGCISVAIGAVDTPYELGPPADLTASGGTVISVTSWNFAENGPVRAWPEGTIFTCYADQLTPGVAGLATLIHFRYLEF